MPNWSSTNYIATGDRKEIRALADTLNTMPNHENGFGRYWMGNLAAFILGKSPDELKDMGLRGTFSPDFECRASFCCPEPDEEDEFVPEEDGTLRFSTISAWNRSEDIERIILERFPNIELSWSSTDEFGNYHETHNPNRLPDLPVFAFNGELYSRNETEFLKEHMENSCPGLEIPENAELFLDPGFRERFNRWKDEAEKDADEDSDIRYIYFDVYKESNPYRT